MDSPSTLARQAMTYLDTGNLTAADQVVTAGLRQFAKDPEIQRSAGLVRMQQGRIQEAAHHLKAAVDANPSDALALNYLGETLFLAGQLDRAKDWFQKTIAADPRFARAWVNIGNLSLAQDDRPGAQDAFEHALDLDPNSPEALLGLGNLADGAGAFDQAMDWYQRTLKANPKYVQAIQNLAVLNFRLGDTQTAVRGLKKALKLHPGDPKLRTTLGLVKLMSGDWSDAWEDYAARLLMPPVSQNSWASWLKLWDGRPLTTDGVVVWMEQGIGDFIVALHALADLQTKVQNIVLACDLRLEPILARSFPDIPVIAPFDIGHAALTERKVTYHVPAFELVRHAYASPEAIPQRGPWFQCDPEGRAGFRAAYEAQAQGRPIIGINWQSRKSIHGNDSSISLDDLAATLQRVNGFYVSLQHGDTEPDLAAFRDAHGLDIYQDPRVDQMKDMVGFVDQVAALDAVLATGSTAVHVAGALQVPVSVLSYDPGDGLIWHRFTERPDSPWYPTMRIMRWTDRAGLVDHLKAWSPPRP